jgi:hypothetical protein
MKMTRFALLAVILFATSCGGSSDNGAAPADNTKQNLAGNPLVGKWYFGGTVKADTPMELYTILDFQATGTLDVYMLTGPNSPHYTFKCSTTFTPSGMQLTISSSDCEKGMDIAGGTGPYSIANNSLTMTMNGDTLTLTKWDGNISSLQEYKGQSTEALDNQPPEKVPTISINALQVPKNFFIFGE